MGWENYHLYRFTIDGVRFGEPDEEYEPDIKQKVLYTIESNTNQQIGKVW